MGTDKEEEYKREPTLAEIRRKENPEQYRAMGESIGMPKENMDALMGEGEEVPEETLAPSPEAPVDITGTVTEDTSENTGDLMPISSPEAPGEVPEETLTNDIGTVEEGVEGSSDALEEEVATDTTRQDSYVPVQQVLFDPENPELEGLGGEVVESTEPPLILADGAVEPDAMLATANSDGSQSDQQYWEEVARGLDGEVEEEFVSAPVGDSTGTDEEYFASLADATDKTESKDTYVAQIRRDYADSGTLGDDMRYVGRQLIQGASNVPDTGLHLISMGNLIPEDATEFQLKLFEDMSPDQEKDLYRMAITATMGTTARQTQEGAAMMGILKKLGELATFALEDESGVSFNNLVETYLPKEDFKPGTKEGKYFGKFVEGAAEGLSVSGFMARNAKKMDNLDSVPAFLRPHYEDLRDKTLRTISEDTFAGGMAILGSDMAVDWWLENHDSEGGEAVFVGLIAGVLSGSFRDPTIVPLTVIDTTLVTLNVGKKITQKGARGLSNVIGWTKESSEIVSEAFNKHAYLKFIDNTVEKVAARPKEEEVNSLFEEAMEKPMFRDMAIAVVESLNIEENFSANYAKAKILKDKYGELELSTVALSETARQQGMDVDAGKLDPTTALRKYKKNRAAVLEIFKDKWKKASPEEMKILETELEHMYMLSLQDTHETMQGVERSVSELIRQRVTGDEVQGKAAREQLELMKAAHKTKNDELYNADPFDKIDVDLDIFDRIRADIRFTDPANTNVTGSVVLKAVGNAIAQRMKRQYADDPNVNFFFKANTMDLDPETAMDLLAGGDLSILSQIKPEFHKVGYNDAHGMVQSLKKLKQGASDANIGPGQGITSHQYGDAIDILNTDFDAGLRKANNELAADRRILANDFYKEFMVGFWDPSRTSLGKALKAANGVEFAIGDSKALDGVFSDPDEMDRFLRLTEEGTAIHTDVGSSKYAQHLNSEANVNLSDAAPKERAALLTAMESHIINKAYGSMYGSTTPRAALHQWAVANKVNLEKFPKIDQEIKLMLSSPNLNSPSIAQAFKVRHKQEALQKRQELAQLTGGGSDGGRVLSILEDSVSTDAMIEALDAVDTTGRLRKTFVSEAVVATIKPNKEGVIDPGTVRTFLDSEAGKNLARLDPEAAEALEELTDLTSLVESSKPAGIKYTTQPPEMGNASWLLRELPRLWTSMRQRETFGADRTRLMLIHAASVFNQKAIKFDQGDQEDMARIFSEILSDPAVADEFTRNIDVLRNARTAHDESLANTAMTRLFAGFGMPVTALPPAIAGTSEATREQKKQEDEDAAAREAFNANKEPKVTRVGRPTHQKDFGNGMETYSERSVTFPINEEKTEWVTFPSVLDKEGTISSESEVRDYVLKNGPIDPITGEEFPTHSSVKDAEEYARERSAGLMEKPE